ncbi:MAG: hypothetical protein IJX22_05360, partial [Opitutales bacterium]|nr:hypothetical protein [Opitutales bacterium]
MRDRDSQVHIKSMKKYKLNVKSRDGLGRGPARRLRNAGLIPGIIYGKGENLPI